MRPPGRSLSVAQQAIGLRGVFPDRPASVQAGRLKWTGVLTPTPLSRDYTISLAYSQSTRPRVVIVDPALRCDIDGDIPHLYRDGSICLNDAHQWDSSMLLVDTVIPWTSEWLYFYELWVATGTWFGDGDERLDLAPVDTPVN
jgi:hypothetical protein